VLYPTPDRLASRIAVGYLIEVPILIAFAGALPEAVVPLLAILFLFNY